MPPHTRVWDETDPDDLDEARFYAQELRETKIDVRERMEVDHEFDDQVDGGIHKKVTLPEGADPVAVANRGIVYAKDVAGITELFYIDSAGTIVQITGGGQAGVNDHSATEAEMKQTASPGISGAPSLATTLFGELDRLRRVLRRHGISDVPKLTTGTTEAGWFDDARVGLPVNKNGAFLDGEATSSPLTPPAYWSLVAGLALISSVNVQLTQGRGKMIELTDGGSGLGGITQTLALKASSRYLVVALVRPLAGKCKVTTTGAVVGTFTNLALESVSGGLVWETLAGVIQTDALPTDIGVNLVAASNNAHWNCAYFHVFALDVNPSDRNVPVYKRTRKSTYSSGNQPPTSGDNTILRNETATSCVVPGPGYSISVDGSVAIGGTGACFVYIERQIDSGAFTVVSSVNCQNSGDYAVTYEEESPVVGSQYTYRLALELSGIGPIFLSTATLSAGTRAHRLRVVMEKI